MVKKISKTNLQGLRELFPVLNEEEMCSYVSGDKLVVNMHDYMDKYNQGIIDAALEEYRQDYSK